uniref:conjugal transfer mating-pair stabilization protein TraG n=1 Tax=Serratia marcescens TaxID=615 RepID=UPI001F4C04B1|nr:conjugal transfer mating-pair stabilization protein TraG [Serratia marcescens]ULG13118.1 conjugal transfer protein TraG [Serratia marcescens]
MDIWVTGNGSIITMGLNFVATMVNTAGWRSILWLAETLGVLTCLIAFVRTHDAKVMFGWGLTFVIVTSALLTPRATVVVNDLNRPQEIGRVDNVPMGLAVPMWLMTTASITLSTGFEDILHLPAERAYSQTGMMFGTRLMQESFVVRLKNEVLAENFNEYVKNCIIPDVQLNHKYTVSQLMQSRDIDALIFKKPSPLRGIMFNTGTDTVYKSCIEVTPTIRSQIAAESGRGGGSFLRMIQRMLPGLRNSTTVLPQYLEGSYNYFFEAGKSSSDILKQNVMIAGIKRGLNSYSRSMGDMGSLVDMNSEMSLMKLKLTHHSGYQMASQVMPLLHTVFMVMFVCLFPLMLLLMFVREMAWPVVKSYLGWFASLMMWPLMFSILNFIVNFTSAYMLKGAGPTLSNENQVMSDATTLAGVAGWLTLTVPFLSNYLFTRIGQGVASAGSYVGNALMSATAGDAGNVASGNYSINNQSVDNVNGFKTDLNRVWRSGQTTTQLGNGATETRTADGQHVYQTGEAMSKLPVDINFDHHRASAAQKLTRESEVQTQTALEGYNHSVTENASRMKQFSDNFGNMSTAALASATGLNTADAKKIQDAIDVGKAYSDRNHISQSQAFAETQNKSQAFNGNVTLGADAKTHEIPLMQYGKGSARLNGNLTYGGSSGSGNQTTQDGRSTQDAGKDLSAREAATFNAGLDVLRNLQTSFRGERADNAASGLLEQISGGINTSDSHYKQYTDSLSRTHEYQQMASNTDTLSAQARSNYTQEFVGYVHGKLSDDEAREVLTNTNSEAVRMRREDLAESFVEDKLRGRLDSHYDQAASHVGDGIRHPGNAAKAAAGAYQGVMSEIDGKVQEKKIRFDTKQRAEQSYNNIENTQKTQDDYVDAREQESKQELETRRAGVETAKQDYRLKQKAAELHQASWNFITKSDDKDFYDEARAAIRDEDAKNAKTK